MPNTQHQARGSGHLRVWSRLKSRLPATNCGRTNCSLTATGAVRTWSILHYQGSLKDESFVRFLAPKLVRLYCRVAQSLLERGETTAAVSLARKANEIVPLDPLPHFALGQCAYYLAEYRQALEHFKEVLPPCPLAILTGQ